MGQQYTEGQILDGSDGKVYVVHAGTPVLQSSVQSRPQIIGRPNPKVMAETSSSESHAAKDRAETPYVNANAKAESQIKAAQAEKAMRENDQQRAENSVGTMTANSQLHGDAYLNANVPASMREVVKAYARGDIGSRSGGLSTSMLPIIQHAMNYDPTTSGTNFPARVKMQSDLAGSQPNTAGGALRAAERMLLHAREVLRSGQSLGNFAPGLLGTIGNNLKTGYNHVTNDPTTHGYDSFVANYAPEAQKAIAQTAGGIEERQSRAAALSASLPQEARAASLQSDAKQARDAMSAVNDQYKRLMGRDVFNALSPDGKSAYDEIMAGGYDEKGRARYPASGYTPISGSAAGATPPGSTPPGSGGPQGGGGPRPDGTSMMYGSGDTGSNIALTAGTSKNVIDPYRAAIASHINNMMLDPKTPDAQILQAITAVGGNPGDALALVKYRRDNPKYQGTYTDALSQIPLSQESVSSGKQSFNNFATTGRGGFTLGMWKGVGALGNIATGGNLPRMMGMDPEVSKAITEQVRSKNPGMYGLGEMTGGTALSGGIGKALSLAGVPAEASLFGRQIPVAALAGDGLYGAVAGADSAPDGQKLLGAGLGALAGPAGGMLGREVVGPGVNALLPRKTTNAALNAGRRLFGGPETALPTPPSSADQSIFNAANKAGIPGIQAQLAEAHSLGVPMSLSDTNPALTALGGSAIRRSPESEQVATSAFLPRARGQMDRLGKAVTRDLGPVGNIRQISADMTAQARTAAGPLYDRAYGQPVASTPELDATLNTPFGRDALGRAKTIAANERRAPSELGFAQDAQGNTVLNPMPSKAISDHLTARAELDDAQAAYRAARTGTGDMTQAQGRVSVARDNLRKTEQGLNAAPDPSMPANIPGYTTQTLDYVKRGMDDVLEQQRNPITGQLALDEAGRAQNGVRQQFLGEVDRLNPAYRDARQTYAGLAQARDAMARGQDAYTMHPDELGIQVANQTPEHLSQMQLGYRDSLMTAGNRQRYSSNPFDATLGSPVAEQRLSTLYPGNPGNTDILRQRDLESGLARSTNDMLGNSKSAQRLIADSEFSGSGGFMGMAAEQGMNAATGGVPVGTMLRGFAKSGIGDALKLGIGKRAIAKADAMAPTLFNTDPQASSNALQHLVDSSQLYQDYIRGNQRSVGRPFGMLGAAAGAGALSGY